MEYFYIAVGIVTCLCLSYAAAVWGLQHYRAEKRREAESALLQWIMTIPIPEDRQSIEEFRRFLVVRDDTPETFFERLNEQHPLDQMAVRLHNEQNKVRDLNEFNVSLRNLIGTVVDEISQLPSGDARFQSIFS